MLYDNPNTFEMVVVDVKKNVVSPHGMGGTVVLVDPDPIEGITCTMIWAYPNSTGSIEDYVGKRVRVTIE